MNIEQLFVAASRQKLRFASAKGDLTTEQLWDLPLKIKSPTPRDVWVDLDTMARVVNMELKAQAEESFVATTTNPLKAQLEMKLEIVKHIIQVRQEENAAKLAETQKAAQREKLKELIAKKEGESLEALSLDELKAMAASL